jgi:hypothetical protein
MSENSSKINWNAANSQGMLKRSLEKIASELNEIPLSKKKPYIQTSLKILINEKKELE